MKKLYLMGLLALGGLGTSPLAAQTAPPNDNICNAIPLQMNSTSAGEAYSNVGATAQTGEPTSECGGGMLNSVWFSFIAPLSSGGVLISTYETGGSLYGTVVTLYSAPNGFDCTSNSFTSLTSLACQDDYDGGRSRIEVNFPLVPGSTYYVQVDGDDEATGTFGIQLNEISAECVLNPSTSADGTTNSAGGRVNLSWDFPENFHNIFWDVNIYTYADAQGTDPQLVKIIPDYTNDRRLIASDETVYWNAVPVFGTLEATGCAISSFTVAAAPLGAIAQTAIPITAASLPYTSPLDNTINYGDDYDIYDQPNINENTQVAIGDFYSLADNDVVYAFTPAQDGAYDFGLTDLTDFNFVNLMLFEGLPFHTVVGYHFAASGPSRSLPGIQLVAGTTYYVVISGSSTTYKLSVKKSAKLTLPAKAYLQAALLNSPDGLMRTSLWDNGILPVTSPYADAMALDANVTNLTADKLPVDWIWAELRDANDPKIVKEGRSALLLKDGSIVDPLDVANPLGFTQPQGNYHLVLKHRNHLGVMTSSTVSLSGSATVVDFTNANSPITYGTHAQVVLNGNTYALWAGNTNGTGQVKFQGSGNGTTNIKFRVLSDAGNTSESNLYSFTGASPADVNMDGQVKYQGSNNDTNTLKFIVLLHPGNTTNSNLFTILEQLPEHID